MSPPLRLSGSSRRCAPVPRARLNRARVVEEAEQIADEVGLSGLTLAALAQRLGIRQPSLYKHIDGIDDLLRALAVRAKAELGENLARATVGRARGDAITAMSHAYRTWASAHPGRYTAAQWVPTEGDTEAEAADWSTVEIVIAVLSGYHLHGDDAIDATRVLRAALHGFVTLETSGSFKHPADIDRSFERLVRGLETALSNWSDETAATMRSR
jgi:AcrR family transcriptional regulator